MRFSLADTLMESCKLPKIVCDCYPMDSRECLG